MDFVVSKVAMAICALLVIAVVSGFFSSGFLRGGTHAFHHILEEFCDLTERAAESGCESEMIWNVPFLPSGDGVTLSINKGTVLLESNEGSAAERPWCGVHLWHSDGRALNESTVTALDDGTGSLVFESGQSVEIVSKSIIFEDEPRIFVFAYLRH